MSGPEAIHPQEAIAIMRNALVHERAIKAELLAALKELLTDMRAAQKNMRHAANKDPRWEGCAEAIQPRVDAASAAIANAEGTAA
jgi:hypothetical protein